MQNKYTWQLLRNTHFNTSKFRLVNIRKHVAWLPQVLSRVSVKFFASMHNCCRMTHAAVTREQVQHFLVSVHRHDNQRERSDIISAIDYGTELAIGHTRRPDELFLRVYEGGSTARAPNALGAPHAAYRKNSAFSDVLHYVRHGTIARKQGRKTNGRFNIIQFWTKQPICSSNSLISHENTTSRLKWKVERI